MLITDKAFPIKERFLILITVGLRRSALPRRRSPSPRPRSAPTERLRRALNQPSCHLLTESGALSRAAFPLRAKFRSPAQRRGACVRAGMCRLRAPNEEKIQLSAAGERYSLTRWKNNFSVRVLLSERELELRFCAPSYSEYLLLFFFACELNN